MIEGGMHAAGASVSRETPEGWQDAWLASANDPWLFATAVLGYLPWGVPNPDGHRQLERWQDRFLKDFYLDPLGNKTASPRHSVRSGHGVGKTTVIAILAIWFPLTHYDSKTVLTANSQDQLRVNNWPELRKQASFLPEPLRKQLQIDEERAYLKAAPEMAFVVRRTASKHNPEALAGIHAEYVLYLIDESSGIDDIIFETAQGSLSTPGAIACMFSNPTRTSGFFYDTHHVLSKRWRGFHVSSLDVPRARGHIEDIELAYGKGSNKWRVRVEGEFPSQDDDTVIPLAWVRAAIDREVQTLDFVPVWGVDVARFGDDASALAKRQANRLLEPVKVWHGKDNMQLTGLIMAEYNATHEDMRPKHILIDVIGNGSGVVDRCREQGLPAIGVNVAESNATVDKCFKLRDELWWKGREWFEARDCSIPNDAQLISELVVPTYDHHSSGRVVVESKKDMKKRVPAMGSPNCADALLLTFAGNSSRKMPKRPDAPVRRDPMAA